jgi:hypothetical protein
MEFSKGLENLSRTWFIDLDGTIVEHNGYKTNGEKLLPNSKIFFESLNEKDYVIITTARDEIFREVTENFLKENNIRYNQIIFGLPTGYRILINDDKPDGTKTAYCLNIERNKGITF